MAISSPVHESESRLLDALASLNQISAAINRMRSEGDIGVQATLQLIVDSAIKVVPKASAVIYAYDQAQNAFDPSSRVSAGDQVFSFTGDVPRQDGIGTRAIAQLRCVLSYEENDLIVNPLIQKNTGAKVAACFPMVVADQVVGALYVFLYEDRHFNQLELLMLDNFVNQAAMAIHQTRRITSVKRDLARTEDELNRQRRAGLLISSRLRLKETLEAILQMAMEVTNAQFGIFRLVDKARLNLVTHAVASAGIAQPLIEILPINGKSVMSWVAQHRQAVLIPDLQAEPWREIYYPLAADVEMRSELVVPLIDVSGRLEGVINLESPKLGAFSEQDSHMLQAMATQAVIAIQEARLLDALQEVAQLLLTQPVQKVLSHLVELANDLLNVAASTIWIIEDNDLVLKAATEGYPFSEHTPIEGSLIGEAISQRKTITVGDLRSESRFNQSDIPGSQSWVRALIVPMLTNDDQLPVGAFSVYSADAEAGRFTESEWDIKVLTCLAHYATLAVHNAGRQEALRAAQEQHSIAETFAAVGDIAANLLHRLNNKIGVIPVRVQGIQDKCGPALEADSYLAGNLAEIEHSASEAMEIVRESLSHLNPIHLTSINVADCVRTSIGSASLPEGIKVEVGALENLPPVVAAQRSLSLVFSNLLENACDAMHGSGTISIQGFVRANQVEVSVTDSGPGIAQEFHDRIFELNFSGSSSRPGKLGFGLWWVKTLMTRLGGSVAVESDGQNGTTFWLRLPRAQ
jgi:signal transduction histidine kinase